jgi:predicted ester cyclase
LRGGIPATGRRVEVSGITISRIREGILIENWGNYDLLGMLQQLGVLPTPDGATE